MQNIFPIKLIRFKIDGLHANAEAQKECRKDDNRSNTEGISREKRGADEQKYATHVRDRKGEHEPPTHTNHEPIGIEEGIVEAETGHLAAGEPQIECRCNVQKRKGENQYYGDGKNVHRRRCLNGGDRKEQR